MFIFQAKRILVVLIGAFMNAITLNFFYINAGVYSSGFTGLSQLLATVFTDYLGITLLTTGIWLIILNIPVILLGWFKVGRRFTLYSILSVLMTSVFLEILPVITITDDIILNAVFGGLISGVSIGLTLKWGASTGGTDIIAMVISQAKDKPVGGYMMVLNGVIITLAGILNEPENALYTLLAVYVSTRMIDAIHTQNEKITAMIVTKKTDELQQAIHEKVTRGMTILPAKGAYSREDKSMLVIVITRYELYDLERIINEVDPNAFTNLIETTDVLGFFRKSSN